MSVVDVVVALVIALGVVGVLVPVLPGSLLVGAAVVGWALAAGSGTAWTVAAVAVALLVIGSVVKYAVPGRRLQAAGIPTSTLVVGSALGVVGFFVVPVVGLPAGFLLGVFVAEWRRLGDTARAWPATLRAVRAVGLGIAIELVFSLLAATTWAVGVVVT